MRYDTLSGPGDAARYTLRALAERYHQLHTEARLHDRVLAAQTDRAAPALTSLFGITTDSATELMMVVGDNPDGSAARPHWPSSAVSAPSPAASGQTSRHPLNCGGHRQVNAALHRILIVRMRFHEPTIAYASRRTAEGKTKI